MGWFGIARFYKDAAPNGAGSDRGNEVGVVSAKVLADDHQEANTKERKFEDVVKSAEQAAVLVLVY